MKMKKINNVYKTITAITLLLLLIATITLLFWQLNKSETNVQNTSSTASRATEGDPSNPATDTQNAKQSASNDTSQTNQTSNQSIDISITSINQSADSLQIRTLISGVHSNGKCHLTISHSEQPNITISSDIFTASNYSTCQGFDVPLSTLPEKGVWKINIHADIGTLTGAVSSNFEVR